MFAISDLHLGDMGPRDNFYDGSFKKWYKFKKFLDYVSSTKEGLVICGDLLEGWQANISLAFLKWKDLLDRLSRMNAIYVYGNHDSDISHFNKNTAWSTRYFLDHGLLRGMCQKVDMKEFRFIHGHQFDRHNEGDTPGLGRIASIYAGLREDRNGGPTTDKFFSVEDQVIGRIERVYNLFARILGRKSRYEEWLSSAMEYADTLGCQVVCGHTHIPGVTRDKSVYNCGSWVGDRCTFFRYNQATDKAGIYEWTDDCLVVEVNDILDP